MSDNSEESLHKLLADLHVHRIATFDPKALQVNIDQRQLLVNTADVTRYPKVGDVLSSFSLHEVNEGAISRDQLVADGPAVLIFFPLRRLPSLQYRAAVLPAHISAGITKTGRDADSGQPASARPPDRYQGPSPFRLQGRLR